MKIGISPKLDHIFDPKNLGFIVLGPYFREVIQTKIYKFKNVPFPMDAIEIFIKLSIQKKGKCSFDFTF